MEDHGQISVGEEVDVALVVSRSPELSRAVVVVPHFLGAELPKLAFADMATLSTAEGSLVFLSHDHPLVLPHLLDALSANLFSSTIISWTQFSPTASQ
jgi:hypothetical protein